MNLKPVKYIIDEGQDSSAYITLRRDKWIIEEMSFVMEKDTGRFEEDDPEDAFWFDRTRFNSPEDALSCYKSFYDKD